MNVVENDKGRGSSLPGWFCWFIRQVYKVYGSVVTESVYDRNAIYLTLVVDLQFPYTDYANSCLVLMFLPKFS